MLTIHLRITDSTTSKPTPVRLRISDQAGTTYAPFGRFPLFACGKGESVGGHLRLGKENFSYSDGSCEIRLPAGVPLRIQAFKGPEFEPLDEEIVLGPGQMAVRFSMTRLPEMRPPDWYSGDTRAHYLSPQAAELEAGAEDLDVVNLLAHVDYAAGMDGHLYPSAPNLIAFTGQAESRIAVNTLNTHPVLGQVGLLNSHRPVYPLTFGAPDETDDWSICDWCDQCHRKGGLTVWTRPFEPLSRLVGGEALVALLLGKIDAIEYDSKPRTQSLLVSLYRLLNAGFHVPLVGGSGKDSNTTALGAVRTLAKLNPDEPLSYRTWIEAVRAGRCFATSGPFVTLTSDSNPVSATATSLTQFDSLEIVADGRVIASVAAVRLDKCWTANVQCEGLPDTVNWIAARCPGSNGFAHTSAVVLRRGEPQAEALNYLRRLVETTREWIDEHGRFDEARRKAHLLELCDQALQRVTSSAPPA